MGTSTQVLPPVAPRTGRKGRYRLRRRLLTPSEAVFYRALQRATAYRYAIFAKMLIADLCWGPGRGSTPGAFKRVAKNHVDFVICDPATFGPLVAFELDDRTGQRSDRRQRDALKDEVFATLGLRLVRQPVQPAYDARELARTIEDNVGGGHPA